MVQCLKVQCLKDLPTVSQIAKPKWFNYDSKSLITTLNIDTCLLMVKLVGFFYFWMDEMLNIKPNSKFNMNEPSKY